MEARSRSCSRRGRRTRVAVLRLCTVRLGTCSWTGCESGTRKGEGREEGLCWRPWLRSASGLQPSATRTSGRAAARRQRTTRCKAAIIRQNQSALLALEAKGEQGAVAPARIRCSSPFSWKETSSGHYTSLYGRQPGAVPRGRCFRLANGFVPVTATIREADTKAALARASAPRHDACVDDRTDQSVRTIRRDLRCDSFSTRSSFASREPRHGRAVSCRDLPKQGASVTGRFDD